MSTSDFELAAPPARERQRELWLQQAAGFIFFEDARRYALSRLDPALDQRAKEVAIRAIDDAIYGVMMIADGVTGALRSKGHRVQLRFRAELVAARRWKGNERSAARSLRRRRYVHGIP